MRFSHPVAEHAQNKPVRHNSTYGDLFREPDLGPEVAQPIDEEPPQPPQTRRRHTAAARPRRRPAA
jgi:hypothetical protein